MKSKTVDIEDEIMLFLDGGSRSLDEIVQRLSWVIPPQVYDRAGLNR